jgi:MerR family mercuric resistance operon transcriptional regulator
VSQKQKEEDWFGIGELSRRTGVNTETIRYYERARLMPRPARTNAGHRTYGSDGLKTLTFIKRSRELGFNLEDIRALLTLRASQGCCVDVKAIAQRHLEAVRGRMRDMIALEKVLAATVARCPGNDSTDCPVLDILDAGKASAAQLQT